MNGNWYISSPCVVLGVSLVEYILHYGAPLPSPVCDSVSACAMAVSAAAALWACHRNIHSHFFLCLLYLLIVLSVKLLLQGYVHFSVYLHQFILAFLIACIQQERHSTQFCESHQQHFHLVFVGCNGVKGMINGLTLLAGLKEWLMVLPY